MLADVLLELKRASRWDESLNTYHEHIEQLLYSLEDISMSIERYASKIEFDPKRLEEVEGRLALISSLKRKYGDSIEEIIAYRDKIAQELAMLEASEEHIEELEKLSFELRQKLSQVAGELSRARKMAAKEMEKAVEHQLRSLMMDRARFKVSITNEADEDGLQVDGEKALSIGMGLTRVEFLISPNPGEPLKHSRR
jgi:DNA repair protein RecN (Recombination protein N)